MIINNNIPALNTHRQLGINQSNMQSSMEKLSSGLRINRAGDDAAGLAISEKMRAQINGLDQASRNAQDGVSLIQTAEGALDETHSILQRMRELAVQSSNDTNTTTDRKELQKEMNQLIEEVDRIAENTEFNTQNLLDGSYNGKKFHIGSNEGQSITIDISNMGTNNMGTAEGTTYESTGAVDLTDIDFSTTDGNFTVNGQTIEVDQNYTDNDQVLADINSQLEGGIRAEFDDADNPTQINLVSDEAFQVDSTDASEVEGTIGSAINTLSVDTETETTGGILTQEDADSAITSINNAIETVSAERSKLGAAQNRLEHTIANLDNSSENLSAAESRIRDVDMAKEIMEMTKSNILSQASQSMLAQANQQPQAVLQLLG